MGDRKTRPTEFWMRVSRFFENGEVKNFACHPSLPFPQRMSPTLPANWEVFLRATLP
jgi:hypothetical protein